MINRWLNRVEDASGLTFEEWTPTEGNLLSPVVEGKDVLWHLGSRSHKPWGRENPRGHSHRWDRRLCDSGGDNQCVCVALSFFSSDERLILSELPWLNPSVTRPHLAQLQSSLQHQSERAHSGCNQTHSLLCNRSATLQSHARSHCTSKRSIGSGCVREKNRHRHKYWPVKTQVRSPQLGFAQTIGIVTALLVLARLGLPSSQAVTLPSPSLVRSCLFNLTAPLFPWSSYKTLCTVQLENTKRSEY